MKLDSLTQVVAESCNLNTEHILVSDLQLWLLVLQAPSKLPSNITNTTWDNV